MALTILQRGRVSYARAELRRKVAYRPKGDGSPETVTRALPAHAWYIVGPVGSEQGSGEMLRVSFRLDRFGDEDGEVRVGARDVTIEPEEGHPITAHRYRAVPIGDLVVDATRRWSENDDGTEVSARQAQALTRPIGRVLGTRENEEWAIAAEAYNRATRIGKPTTEAVRVALRRDPTPKGRDQARHIIRQARRDGLIPPVASTRR